MPGGIARAERRGHLVKLFAPDPTRRRYVNPAAKAGKEAGRPLHGTGVRRISTLLEQSSLLRRA
jgi:hypothetical protein